jgi:hypothetical protein
MHIGSPTVWSAVAGALLLTSFHAVEAQETRRIEYDVQVGETDGADAYVFGNVAAIAVSPSGDLLVLDNMSRRVQAYGRDGKHVRTIGRRGFGPGEFQAPWGLAVAHDHRVIVRDLEIQRYSVFGPDGSYERSFPAPSDRTFWDRMRADTLGRAYDGRRTWADSTSAHYVLRFRPEVQSFEPDSLQIPRSTRDVIYLPGRAGPIDQPFLAEFFWDVGPDGTVWTAWGEDYLLTGWRGGRAVVTIEHEYRPIPIPAPLLDSAVSEATELAMSRTEMRSAGSPREALASLKRPETYPPIQDLGVDRIGRVWVRVPSESATGEAVFDVFDSDGRFSGRLGLILPPASSLVPRLLAFGDEVLYTVVSDVLGVRSIVGYTIPTDWEGSSRER